LSGAGGEERLVFGFQFGVFGGKKKKFMGSFGLEGVSRRKRSCRITADLSKTKTKN
jgi:hypothetical protein